MSVSVGLSRTESPDLREDSDWVALRRRVAEHGGSYFWLPQRLERQQPSKAQGSSGAAPYLDADLILPLDEQGEAMRTHACYDRTLNPVLDDLVMVSGWTVSLVPSWERRGQSTHRQKGCPAGSRNTRKDVPG